VEASVSPQTTPHARHLQQKARSSVAIEVITQFPSEVGTLLVYAYQLTSTSRQLIAGTAIEDTDLVSEPVGQAFKLSGQVTLLSATLSTVHWDIIDARTCILDDENPCSSGAVIWTGQSTPGAVALAQLKQVEHRITIQGPDTRIVVRSDGLVTVLIVHDDAGQQHVASVQGTAHTAGAKSSCAAKCFQE
jgi:hypothetical protein